MDSTSLKTLNAIAPFHFRTRVSLFRPFFLHQVHRNRFYPICSLSKRGSDSSLPNGAGERVAEISNNRLLQVVLVSPQIPGNTGTIARTCAASAVGLHLIEPLGFQVDDAKLKRAGLDYWPDMWLLKFMTRGQNFGNISDNRKEKSGCWHLPREEQTFILISPIEKEIGSYSARKLVGYHLKLCLTARVKPLAVVQFESQWLKLMLDV